MKELWSKIKEALISALPITLMVYLVALLPDFSFNQNEIISFTIGAVLLILGIGLFNLGADIAMTPMGIYVGAGLSRQKVIALLLSVCFVLGMLITIAEPDLQVLANQVSSVMSGKLLMYTVGFGVGAFLIIAILRIIFKRRLSNILMLFYMLLFALALILSENGNIDLLPMAFDSGGVTTGPITVPFIMALGVGISSVLGDRRSQENSFGLVSLCSIGPILARNICKQRVDLYRKLRLGWTECFMGIPRKCVSCRKRSCHCFRAYCCFLPTLPNFLLKAAKKATFKNWRWRCIYIFGTCYILDRC